eukprot:12809749-Alexandrium_andersonii.AAC.1
MQELSRHRARGCSFVDGHKPLSSSVPQQCMIRVASTEEGSRPCFDVGAVGWGRQAVTSRVISRRAG